MDILLVKIIRFLNNLDHKNCLHQDIIVHFLRRYINLIHLDMTFRKKNLFWKFVVDFYYINKIF